MSLMRKSFPRCLIVSLTAWTVLALPERRRAPADEPVADPSAVRGRSEPTQPAGPPTAPAGIYRAKCLKCHDTDGKGEIVRDVMPKVPDFTDGAWHARRSDSDLGRTILEGKGKSMPAFRGKLGAVDSARMVAFIRAFRGGAQVVEDVEETPAEPEPERPAVPAPAPAPAPRAGPDPAGPRRPATADARPREGGPIFGRSCAVCHSADGRGDAMRDTLPSIPDFSAHIWQESRSDPQLVISVLDGRGSGMPAFRDKVSGEQARALVAFIRSFDPSRQPAIRRVDDDFEARFQQLVAEFEDLRRRSRALASDAAPAASNDGQSSGAGRP